MLSERWNKLQFQCAEDSWDEGKRGSSVMLDDSQSMRRSLVFPALVMHVPMYSNNELLSPSCGCRARDLPTKATRYRDNWTR
jgi:hypothetical protein